MAGHPAWGWHPLTASWARVLVAESGVQPGDLVLDIGAGDGALTAPLVRAGAQVVAVELHPRRADRLRRRFAGDPVTVVQVDASDLRLPRRPFRVVANPPYALTGRLVRRLLAPGSRLVEAHLVLQHAAARRLAAADDGPWCLTLGRRLPRGAFRNPPRVDSTVLVVRRRTLRGADAVRSAGRARGRSVSRPGARGASGAGPG